MTDWLPEPLRVSNTGDGTPASNDVGKDESEALPDFLAADEGDGAEDLEESLTLAAGILLQPSIVCRN